MQHYISRNLGKRNQKYIVKVAWCLGDYRKGFGDQSQAEPTATCRPGLCITGRQDKIKSQYIRRGDKKWSVEWNQDSVRTSVFS